MACVYPSHMPLRPASLVLLVLAASCGAGKTSIDTTTVTKETDVEGRVWRAEGLWTGHPFSVVKPGRAISLAIDGDTPPYHLVTADFQTIPSESGGSDVIVSVAQPRIEGIGSTVVWLSQPEAAFAKRAWFRYGNAAASDVTANAPLGDNDVKKTLCALLYDAGGTTDSSISRSSPFGHSLASAARNLEGVAEVLSSAYSNDQAVYDPSAGSLYEKAFGTPSGTVAEMPFFSCSGRYGFPLRACIDDTEQQRIPAHPLVLFDGQAVPRRGLPFLPAKLHRCSSAHSLEPKSPPIAHKAPPLARCAEEPPAAPPQVLKTWSSDVDVPAPLESKEWTRSIFVSGYAIALHPTREPTQTKTNPRAPLERCVQADGVVRVVWYAEVKTVYPGRCNTPPSRTRVDNANRVFLVPSAAIVRGYGIRLTRRQAWCRGEQPRRPPALKDRMKN